LKRRGRYMMKPLCLLPDRFDAAQQPFPPRPPGDLNTYALFVPVE
jgi:hypothetical protein